MTQSTWGLGEFEEVLHELRRSGHALQEAIEDLVRYSEQEGDYADLHFEKAFSAIGLAEQRIFGAKRKLASFNNKKGKAMLQEGGGRRDDTNVQRLLLPR